MPSEIVEIVDTLASITHFRSSPLFELIMGIRNLFRPARWQEGRSQRARAALPPELLANLSGLYVEFEEDRLYSELPIDYPDHDDVPGFFAYLSGLSDADFVFYLLGRVLRREILHDLLPDANAIREAILEQGEPYGWYGRRIGPILADLPGFRARLVDAWERAWNVFFAGEIAGFSPMWHSSIADKQFILEREGGQALYEKLMGRKDLPSEFPPGMPFTSITYIPVVMLPSRVIFYYGYGDLTILFDPLYDEERRLAVEQSRGEALDVLKALNDKKRLEILRLIARNDGLLHGKLIAERTGSSASAVSRHLTMLKEGKLVVEEPQKNLIVYRIQRETLTSLTGKLLDYLYG